MSVKERLLAIKMAEKKKKNPRFFKEIKVDVKITDKSVKAENK